MMGWMANRARGAAALGMALAVAGVVGGSWTAEDADAGKGKGKYPNVAVKAIALAPHADAGHKTVVVTVANVGLRNANGFRIGMSAQRQDGTVRDEAFSQPISLPKGTTIDVEFRLGCGWIDFGAVTARTDPSPVPGEPPTKTANNVRTQAFGAECL